MWIEGTRPKGSAGALLILEKGEVRPAEGVFGWAAWVSEGKAEIARHGLPDGGAVRTVFVGRHDAAGQLVLFVTRWFEAGVHVPRFERPSQRIAGSTVLQRFESLSEACNGHANWHRRLHRCIELAKNGG